MTDWKDYEAAVDGIALDQSVWGALAASLAALALAGAGLAWLVLA